jgi:hypothetical protein
MRKQTPAHSAQQALIRNAIGAIETDARDPALTDKVARVYGYTTAAANLLLAGVLAPPEFRGFVDALVGVAGDRSDWFSASDKEIARHAGRSTKWVQDWRRDLTKWQTAQKVTFIEIEDNYMDRDGEKHPHRYRVHLSRFVAECALDARASNEWETNREAAIERAARTLKGSLPKMLPRSSRTRRREQNAATMIERSLNHAVTLIQKAVEIEAQVSGQVKISPEIIKTLRLHLETLTKVVENFSTTPNMERKSK